MMEGLCLVSKSCYN